MDNQQERPVTPEYVAGLITGEGSFFIYGQPTSRGTTTFRPGFGIQMNDIETMDLVIESFKKWGLPVHVCPAHSNGGKVSKRISVGGCKRIKRIIDFFLPYLTGNKRAAALKALEFITSRLAKPRGFSPYTREELQMVKDLRLKINSGRSHKTLERMNHLVAMPDRRPSLKGRRPNVQKRLESSETTRCAPLAGEDIVQTHRESM